MRWAEYFGIWKKKTGSWFLDLDEASRFSELAEARPVVCGGVPHVVGIRWKSQHRKKLCLSLLMSKNLKPKKVKKSFVPEPISCFSDFYALWILQTFFTDMNISHTYIWLCYKSSTVCFRICSQVRQRR